MTETFFATPLKWITGLRVEERTTEIVPEVGAKMEAGFVITRKSGRSDPSRVVVETDSLENTRADQLKHELEVPKFIVNQPPKEEEFSLLKKLDGFVVELLEDGFRARFVEPSTLGKQIEAEFDFADLSEGDLKIASPGVPIVWAIGYERRDGTVRRQSILYLRRIPVADADEIEKMRQQLDELFV